MRPLVATLLVACSAPHPRALPDADTGGDDAPDVDAPVTSDACLRAASENSNIGCRFWAVDLANAVEVDGAPNGNDCSMYGAAAKMLGTLPVCVATDGTFAGRCDPGGSCAAAPAGATCQMKAACGLDAQHAPFAIAVANVGTAPADVTLADATGTTSTTTVAPGATATLLPQQLGFPDHSIEDSGIAPSAYLLTSSQPIIAYQLDPFNEVTAFSSDASVLLPEATFGTDYVGLAYANFARRPNADDWRGYVTIVAAADAHVDITPPTDAIAGTTQIAAGQTASFVLHAFDTLEVTAATGDITGTSIHADRPVGAFAGHEAAVIADPFPFRNPCCADHLEEQLYPTTTWGKTYAIAHGRARVTQIHDYVRVVAQAPNTLVQITPTPETWASACPGTVLATGQMCELWTQDDVEIRSNQPILVAHYMVSGGGLGPDSGDPSLAYVPPVEQFRDSYTLVVPDLYHQSDVDLVAPAGSPVVLDGVDVSLAFAPFASGAYSAARMQIMPGAHTIACPMKCSVEVAGWNTAVSYLYSGGLDLANIVQ